jgi:hypothetical protein
MRHWLYILTIACLGLGLMAAWPTQANADEYWDGYWGWYDGTYAPYYSRRAYSYGYPSSGYYGPAYGSAYGGYYGDPYMYGRGRYYGNYYGTPNFGYGDFRGGSAVRVGPMRFGWR